MSILHNRPMQHFLMPRGCMGSITQLDMQFRCHSLNAEHIIPKTIYHSHPPPVPSRHRRGRSLPQQPPMLPGCQQELSQQPCCYWHRLETPLGDQSGGGAGTALSVDPELAVGPSVGWYCGRPTSWRSVGAVSPPVHASSLRDREGEEDAIVGLESVGQSCRRQWRTVHS